MSRPGIGLRLWLLVLWLLIGFPLLEAEALTSDRIFHNIQGWRDGELALWQQLHEQVAMIGWGAAALSIIGALVLLCRRRRSSLSFAVLALWLSTVAANVAQLELIYTGFGAPFDPLGILMRGSRALALVATVLTLFCLSRRARAAFPLSRWVYADE